MKTCSKCSETKPRDEFSKDRSRRDGKAISCRSCIAERSRRYREANREELRRKNRAHQQANRERLAAKSRDYREANREQVLQKQREYYEATKDERRQYSKAWRRANPGYWWADDYRKRAKAVGIVPIVDYFSRAEVVERYGDSCFYCGGEFEHLDHFIPIKGAGPHTLENARPSCAACNMTKRNASPDEWVARRADAGY